VGGGQESYAYPAPGYGVHPGHGPPPGPGHFSQPPPASAPPQQGLSALPGKLFFFFFFKFLSFYVLRAQSCNILFVCVCVHEVDSIHYFCRMFGDGFGLGLFCARIHLASSFFYQ
jgi:hypothetical protein